jgi:hypothetical protein
MRINSLEINGAGGTGDVLATVTIDAFYEPLPTNISNLDQPVTPPTADELKILSNLATSGFPSVGSDQDFSGPKGKSNPFE